MISPEHAPRNLVIGGMIQTKEGWLAQIADGEGLGAFHISKDGGKTWNDEGKVIPNNFVEGGTGGSIAGIHAGVVQLSNGNFIAFGRGSNIVNKEGRPCMPMSISTDHGKTWKYSASEFTPVTGGQRLVLKRLNEGAILLVSFTHTSPTPNVPFDSTKYEKMIFKNKQGAEFRGYGMFAALSFDEGKTWTMKKLVTDGKERHLDGGGNTKHFQMDKTHAEPRGYLAITQTPDNTIHLISSNIHYRFNLKWLMQAND